MKDTIVTLARPATVHDVMRYPVEGSLTVTKDEANRLMLAGVLVGDDDAKDDDGDGLDAMKVADLHAFALKEGVALHDAKKKDDIVAAIRAHRSGVLVGDDDAKDDDGDGLDAMKVADLHAFALKEGVALHDAKKKDDIVAAIRAHRSGNAAPDYERDSLKDLDLATASKDQLLVIAAYEKADVPQGDAATEDELRTAITAARA